MPGTLHISGVWPEKIAPAMSLMRFALPFGGTLSLTIMGAVFNNKLSGMSPSGAGAGSGPGFNAHNSESLSFIANLPDAVQHAYRIAGKKAVMWAFISIMPILGISVVTGLGIGNVWIRKKKGQRETETEKGAGAGEEDGSSSEVIYVPYLWALLKVLPPFFPFTISS